MLRTADLAAPSVALGAGITRIGCFLNGCCHGTPCDLPWALAFPDGSIPAQAFGDALLHPTQLYASLAGFGGFAALILLSRRSARDGAVLCALLVLLGLTRFTIDFFRHYPDPEVVLLPGGVAVPIHQLLALAFVLAGGVLALPLGGWLALWLDEILSGIPGFPERLRFFVLEPRTVLIYSVLLLVTGSLSASYPVYLAARLPITATLRKETVS